MTVRTKLQDKVDYLGGEAESLRISLRHSQKDTKEAYELIQEGDKETKRMATQYVEAAQSSIYWKDQYTVAMGMF